MTWKPAPPVVALTPISDGITHDHGAGRYGVLAKVADKAPYTVSQGAITGDVSALPEITDPNS